MRLASYNVENLFDRARVMNLPDPRDGRKVLEAFAKLSAALAEIDYTPAVKAQIVDHMIALGLEKSDETKFVVLRRNRGRLLTRRKSGGIEITADGRADWTGSLELVEEPVNQAAMQNTARVIIELQADVLGIIEAESRPVLATYNDKVLKSLGGKPFAHVMLIDGNDTRGIDVGLMSRSGFRIGLMRSHVDDRLAGGARTFSRDCPEFFVGTPKGNTLVVLVNHFKSKGYGSAAQSDKRRENQARAAQKIAKGLIDAGYDYVALIGDLNDTPKSAPLKPLFAGGHLRDAFEHAKFDDGGYPGTYGSCGPSNKIDYLLLSPKLFQKVTAGGVLRKGMWPGVRPVKWEAFPEVTRPEEAASDHAAIWVDVDI